MSHSDMRRRGVCLIGMFAPAAGGQAAVNESFRRQLHLAGASTFVIDISHRGGPATLFRRLSRLPKVFGGLAKLIWLVLNRKASLTYIGIAGGFGQIYDLLFVEVSRFGGIQLYLNHDSYAYLDRASVLIALVLRVAGYVTKQRALYRV